MKSPKENSSINKQKKKILLTSPKTALPQTTDFAPKLKIGCAGWSYDDWKGGFYPPKSPKTQYLSYYAHFFNFAEINSSFYNVPTPAMLKAWDLATPENFRFSPKVWRQITHNYHTNQVESAIQQYFGAFGGLSHKISNFLLQFPPKFSPTDKNLEKLNYILTFLPKTYQYFLELRDNNWFSPILLHQVKLKSNMQIATSYMVGLDAYYAPTQSQYYIRMIGDRSITQFSRQQRTNEDQMDDLISHVQQLGQSPDISEIFVIFNNHFRGFSPQDVNEFKKRLNLPFREFKKQKTLLDFQ